MSRSHHKIGEPKAHHGRCQNERCENEDTGEQDRTYAIDPASGELTWVCADCEEHWAVVRGYVKWAKTMAYKAGGHDEPSKLTAG